jgi:DNA repair protein RecO (recombination protein O)
MGGAVCDSCAPPGAPRLDPATITHLGALLTGEWVLADKADDAVRTAAGGIAAAYAQWHIEQSLRSLRIVDRGAREEAV